MSVRSIFAAAVLLTALAAWSQEPAWVGSWGASPLPPSAAAGPFPATPEFTNETVRQIVRLSVGGERLRLRLTNEYGTEPLVIGAVRVALADGVDGLEAGSERIVTFAGDPTTTIPAGAPLLSDPVDLEVDDLAVLSVSLYLPGDTGPCTCHATGMQEAYVSPEGDFTEDVFEPARTIQSRAFLSGVEVRAPGAKAVVVLGDSISDGVGSTPGANSRWPDLLAERLSERGGRARFGVVNHGISGNRVLSNGAGESALARFDRDVLSVPGASHVVVFEGVNDVGLAFGSFEGPIADLMPAGEEITAEEMIAGYRQLIARAHSQGLTIYGATIAPYEGAAYYSVEGEAVRQRINEWIRTSGAFDGVLDFDAVFRDPEQPARMLDGLHSGDFLHGSDAGYRAVADSIDLGLFR